jgi:hypothetical protein
MGQVGIIFDEPHLSNKFWQWIKEDILTMNYDIKWSQKQGKKFGRARIKNKIEKLLQKYVRDKK